MDSLKLFSTLAPVAPRARAIAFPIPREAPVTTQTGESTAGGLEATASSAAVAFTAEFQTQNDSPQIHLPTNKILCYLTQETGILFRR